MRVRLDVCLGETGTSIDTSFLEHRKTWLQNTGIYLEFMLKGTYPDPLDFNVVAEKGQIAIARHAWNRFFLNIKSSDKVDFKVLKNGSPLASKAVTFSVDSATVPLLFTYPYLLSWSVSDIRFFANRISENMVTGTRFVLFSSKFIHNWAGQQQQMDSAFWKLHELLLSILTERGLSVYITPFDEKMLYTPNMLHALRELLLVYIERNLKFNVVWDIGSEFRKKEVSSLVDSVSNRFGKNVRLSIPEEFFSKVGGEGFSQTFTNFKANEPFEVNERGVKIARLRGVLLDYYGLRSFTREAVKNGWGVEYVYSRDVPHIRKIQYSLSRALYQGYCDCGRTKHSE